MYDARLRYHEPRGSDHDDTEGERTEMQTGKGIDRVTYDATKDYLKAALEQMIVAGHSVKDLAEFAADKFGDSFYPYLREFQQDIRAGRIKVQGLVESSRASIFGAHVNPEERERLIREAAYLRAEQRGFSGGSPDEDWMAAEAEIDEMLTRKAGLFQSGNKALDSARATARQEAGSIKTVVWKWIEGKEQATAVPPADRTQQTDASAAGTSQVAPGKPEAAAATKKPAAAAKPRSRKSAAAGSVGKSAPATKQSASTDASTAKPFPAVARKPSGPGKPEATAATKKPTATAKPSSRKRNGAAASNKPAPATRESAATEDGTRPASQQATTSGVKKADEQEAAAAQNRAASAGRRTSAGKTTAAGKRSAGRARGRGASRE